MVKIKQEVKKAGVVRATNAGCKCEHGYKTGVGFPVDRCQEDAGYFSYDEKIYLCHTHSTHRV